MYLLLLFLLLSPAFGQQLDDLLNNSELFEKVSEGLDEPEKSILEAALDPSSALIGSGAEERFCNVKFPWFIFRHLVPQ